MVEDKRVPYHQCRTCGRWHPVEGGYGDQFCSRECARRFSRCPVCGEYFETVKGTERGFCSAGCEAIPGSEDLVKEKAKEKDKRTL